MKLNLYPLCLQTSVQAIVLPNLPIKLHDKASLMHCEVFSLPIKQHGKGNLMWWFELLSFPNKSMAKVILCGVKCSLPIKQHDKGNLMQCEVLSLHIHWAQHHKFGITRPFPRRFFPENSKHSIVHFTKIW